jgi:hypothetical protein
MWEGILIIAVGSVVFIIVDIWIREKFGKKKDK